jgi:(1->4)-alpha-D-glucan 1-alpha-D-glucosylmutase
VSLYLLAEKILSPNEELPSDWPVTGTTGYDFLNRATSLFINGENLPALDAVYFEFINNRTDFTSLVSAGQKKILNSSMRGDFLSLVGLLRTAASHTRYGLDFSPEELSQALLEVLAAFPVYRTYITEQTESPTREERRFVEQAIDAAKQANARLSPDVFNFIQSLLLLSLPRDLNETGRRCCREFVLRFQQLAGPVMAKGLEDTAFYNFNRLICLNEVGGAPGAPEAGLEKFHAHNASRAQRQPHSLLATATHDTKRGEDARARICVLSELPSEWRQAVLRWSGLNATKKTEVGGSPAPDPNDEYLLYQSLLGAWVPEAETPGGLAEFRERIAAYMLKATREAKTHTSWTEPNAAYEQATRLFVERVLTHSDPFLDDFMLFYRKVTLFGLFNSLSQVVLKMTAPGVPDFYQGTELWDHNLVDPDNRRRVDFQTRQRLFSELRDRFPGESQDIPVFLRGLLRNYQNGQIKLYIIWKTLELRRRQQQLFEQGDYLPIYPAGAMQQYVCAFARTVPAATVITVATRLAVGLTKGAERAALEPDLWQDTVLPIPESARAERYRDVLTQRVLASTKANELPLKAVLDLLPVAVLEGLE